MEIYQNQAAREYVGGVAMKGMTLDPRDYGNDIPRPVLERIIERVREQTAGTIEIACQLAAHADRVHGESALNKSSTGPAPRPVRSGIIGSLEDALDDLSDAHSRCAEQADRNCRLA